MDKDTKRSIILKHYKNPVNKKENTNENYKVASTNNESCIDNIHVHVLYEKEYIKDITFDGEACAISISSTSIMIENLIGKTIKEAKAFIENFEAMIENKPYDKNVLNSAIVYDEIYKQNARKKCATLPYRALKKLINESENT